MITTDVERSVLGLAQKLGTIPGKKALQKFIYFLQEAEGVPLGLQYDMYQYGPYSLGLELMTKEMEATRKLIVRMIDDTYQISPYERSTTNETSDAIDGLVQKLGDSRPKELELLASLHYLAALSGYTGTPEGVALLKQKLALWKGTKFTPIEVETAINKLRQIGYLR